MRKNCENGNGYPYSVLIGEIQRLRIENVFLRSAAGKAPPESIDRVLDIIFDLRQDFPLSPILSAAGIPRSSYYYYLKRAERPDKYALEREAIQEIYKEHSGLYGYRRITIELKKRGFSINHKTVYRLMCEMGLKGRRQAKPYTSFKGDSGETVPNLLGQRPRPDMPLTHLATDITKIMDCGRALYLCVLVDLFSGEIVSHHTSRSPGIGLIIATLEKLPKDELPQKDLSNGLPVPHERIIIHSDRGWQYQSERYRKYLRAHGFAQSMTQSERCYGNPAAESFFSTLKSELPIFAKDEAGASANAAALINRYINYYNNKRIKSGLGGLSPVEYRQKSAELIP